MLPGVHRVRKPRADGGVTEYWYAFRGGPQILKATAKSDALLAKEIAKLLPAAIAARDAGPHDDTITLYGLITKYLASKAFEGLAERTRRDRRKFLEIVRKERGEDELDAYAAAGMKKVLINWRKPYEKHPKHADELFSHLSAALTWGVDEELCPANPLATFKRLYTCNRAEIIWEPAHLAKLYPHCAIELRHAVRLAVLTGARLGDLLELTWGNVGEHAMTWQTNKSRNKRTVVVPVTKALRALLNEIPRGDSLTILNSSKGTPWTQAGLGSAFRLAKIDAGIAGLRWHDFRGTAATNFSRDGLEPAEIATILGWAPEQVRGIITRYVSSEAIGLALVEKLRRNAKRTSAVNRGVNRG